MKQLVMIFLSFFSMAMSSYAVNCPNLSGRWICENPDGKKEGNTIVQSKIFGGMEYVTTTDSAQVKTWLVDGRPHPLVADGIEGTETFHCRSNARIDGELQGKFTSDTGGSFKGKVFLDAATQDMWFLHIGMEWKSPGGDVTQYDEVIRCLRQK